MLIWFIWLALLNIITKVMIKLVINWIYSKFFLRPPSSGVLSRSRFLVFFVSKCIALTTGKTQPDDVCWLVVRGLLVPAYPKEQSLLLRETW